MSKIKDLQRLINRYREETGNDAVDMKDVAQWAIDLGMAPPTPKTPVEILASEFSKAARQEVETDKETGYSYRVNQNFTVQQGSQQLSLWVPIDKANHSQMHKSMTNRREQMVGDALQLSNDVDRWNRMHPTAKQLHLDLNFEDDVRWRRNADTKEEVII